jgi:hypothetical protein
LVTLPADRFRAGPGIFRTYPVTSFFARACVFGWSQYPLG